MENTNNYSDNWQPYTGDYDKFEYDIKLADGTIVENCYPNKDKFIDLLNETYIIDAISTQIDEIRFSNKPCTELNWFVSPICKIYLETNPPELIINDKEDEELVKRQEENRKKRVVGIINAATMAIMPFVQSHDMYEYKINTEPTTKRQVNQKLRNVGKNSSGWYSRPITDKEKEQSTIGRNEPCPCGSGKKFKKCCSIL